MSTKKERVKMIKAARQRKADLQARLLEEREKRSDVSLSMVAENKAVPEIKERDFDCRRVLTGHYNSVQCVDWSGDCQRLVSASQAGNVVVWDGMLGRKLNRVRFDMKWLLTCSFTKSKTGSLIAAGGLDNCCTIFKVPIDQDSETDGLPSGTKVAKLSGHGGYMSCCPFLKGDDNQILTGCGDGVIRLWNVETGKRISELREHTKDITNISVLDTNMFAASSYDGVCSIWDLRTSKVTHRYVGHDQNILSVAFHPGGTSIASGFETGVVSIYEMRAMAEVVKFSMVEGEGEEGAEGGEAGGEVKAASPTKTVSPAPGAGGGGEDGEDGEEEEGNEPPEVKSLTFSSSGRFLYASFKNEVVEWDTLKGFSTGVMQHPGLVSSCALSPDGKAVGTACWDTMVRIWTPKKK